MIGLSKRGLEMAEQAANPVDLGRAYMMHSESLGVGGRLDDAVTTALKGAAVMGGLGLERTHGSFLILNAAQFAMARDRWDEASELIEQALDKSTHTFTRVYGLSLRAPSAFDVETSSWPGPP